MGLFAAGSVVVVRYPFTDLSLSKSRPAVVLADAGFDDWILCQVTSNPFSDPLAVTINPDDFHAGSLRQSSFARPAELFTGNSSLISSIVGELELDKLDEILDAVIKILQASRQP